MGQSLSEPKTEKKTDRFENRLFSVGSSCMQGWRLEMEDAHSVHLHFAQDPDSAYFAVFDGHGGSKFAQYCGSQLHHCLQRDPAFKNGDYGLALKNSFLSIDRSLSEDLQMQNEPGGTTAIVSLVRDDKIYCANAGDSRAVACVAGKVQELSHDHKPYNQGEEARIYRAGGWVEFSRVNGNLALSRAIGDFNFKSNPDLPQAEQIVTADPEVITVDITPDHEFIVLACDGVWDVMSNVEVAEFIRKKIASNMKPPLICEALLDHCLAPDCRMGGVGCDNMSVILVCFMHRDSYGDLVYRCSRDFNKVSRTRRMSSMDNIDHHKLRNRDRRMSEPPVLTRAPLISSKLAGISDVLLPNGNIGSLKGGASGKVGDVEGRGGKGRREGGGKEEGEGEEEEEEGEDEDSEIVVPLETTL